MPPLKQPTPLEDRAMEVLVNFFSSFCNKYEHDPDKLQSGINFIKNETLVPPKLAVKIYNRLLWALNLSWSRCGDHVLKITEKLVMDQTLIGYDIPPVILASLSQQDAARVGGVIRLRLNHLELPYRLDTLGLENLTILGKQGTCTDSDLVIIGKNCPMLKHVDVSYSGAVTDVGLASLASCTNLQYLAVTNCKKVSTSGLNHLLSVNKLIRQLEAWPFNSKEAGFDFSTDKNWRTELTVHESLESFTIVESFTDRHLLHLVRRFPNLRSIKITSRSTVNLSNIKSFSKLAKIEYDAGNGSRWADFESVLEFFGPQIDELRVQCESFNIVKRGIKSMFRLCENLEVLDILHRDQLSEFNLKVVVPPFKNLRVFCLRTERHWKLELGGMPKLERLLALGYDWGRDQIESIIFDHTNFPNLKEIHMRENLRSETRKEDEVRIEHIIKTNNLDIMFRIGFS